MSVSVGDFVEDVSWWLSVLLVAALGVLILVAAPLSLRIIKLAAP
jgi:hypothetical protein